MDQQRRQNFSKYYTYSIVATKYLNKLKKYIGSSSVEDSELKAVNEELENDEKELKNVDKEIEELVEKKKLL